MERADGRRKTLLIVCVIHRAATESRVFKCEASVRAVAIGLDCELVLGRGWLKSCNLTFCCETEKDGQPAVVVHCRGLLQRVF